MKSLFSLLVLGCCVASASVAQAGVFGSSTLNISNLRVLRVASGTVATGTFDTDANGFNFRIGSSTTTATNTARLNGVTDIEVGGQSITGNNSGGSDGGATDAPLAIVSSGTNFFSADTSFAGAPLNVGGVFGLGTGASALTTSSFNIDNGGFLGNSDGNVTSFASVSFTSNANIQASIDFNASVIMSLTSNGVPTNLASFASTSFGVTLIRTSGSPATIAAFAPGVLNQSISVVGAGTDSIVTGVIPISTGPFTLQAGATYTLTLNQTATVRVVAAIPEPASVAVFGLMGLGAVVTIARRRR